MNYPIDNHENGDEGHHDGHNGEGKFGVRGLEDQHDELNGEGNEEVQGKLEQHDQNLVGAVHFWGAERTRS